MVTFHGNVLITNIFYNLGFFASFGNKVFQGGGNIVYVDIIDIIYKCVS